MERIDIRHELPPPASEVKDRETEVLRLLCNGFTAKEAAGEIFVSKRTVEFHKAELFNSLGARNQMELVRVATSLRLIKDDELNFYGRDFALRPKPVNREQREERREKRAVSV